MSALRVNFCRETGRIKPLHAVNNGPTGNLQDFQPGQVRKVRTLDNLEEYYAAGFPFARIHDASFFTGYGLDHTVDVRVSYKKLLNYFPKWLCHFTYLAGACEGSSSTCSSNFSPSNKHVMGLIVV